LPKKLKENWRLTKYFDSSFFGVKKQNLLQLIDKTNFIPPKHFGKSPLRKTIWSLELSLI